MRSAMIGGIIEYIVPDMICDSSKCYFGGRGERRYSLEDKKRV